MRIGAGSSAELADVLARLGLFRPLIVTDRYLIESGRAQVLLESIKRVGLAARVFGDTDDRRHGLRGTSLSRGRTPTVLTTLDQCERTVVRSLALGSRGHRQTRFLLQPPRVLLFKAIDEPTSRRPRWAVGPIDGRHCYDVTVGGRGLGRNLNERAACQVHLDHVHRQAAKSKSCPQKGKLGPEVGKAPHSGG